ncbi:YxiJ family protein [Planococcus sp. FY231025]|uniref:YxiJ family protein n=1 Tax=Planococcus sp. FY231025 TaxID=3455699 RepID=UPI003F8F6EC2
MIDNQLVIELKNLYENELSLCFPSDEIEKLENLLGEIHPEIEDFIMDFNEYCDLIAGSCTYVIIGNQVPKPQSSFLKKDFFQSYPQYAFLQAVVHQFPELMKEMLRIEKARKMLVKTL